MSFLGNLSTGSTKPRVYLSVTPGVGLEMIQLDYTKHEVVNYAVRDLVYDEKMREITDYTAFANATAEMFQELNISPKCEVVLNMPLVVFGKTDQFGLMIGNEQVTGGIESMLDTNYVFQRTNPTVTWQDIPSAGASDSGEYRNIIYAAIQSTVIEQLGQALAKIGANLIRVENSLTSTLRALDYTGCAQAQMQPNVSWNLMIVNSVGYSVVSMLGTNIVDYYEEPLPVKSLEGDSIYEAINQSAQIALMNYTANYLFILSDSDRVSAEVLATRLHTQSKVLILENNSFKKEDLLSIGLNVLQTYSSKISLQAIGTAVSDVLDYPVHLSFAGTSAAAVAATSCKINIGEKEYELTKKGGFYVAAVLAIPLLVVLLLSHTVFPGLVNSKQKNLDEINSKISTIDAEIKKYQNTETTTVFNVKTEIENGIKNNRSKLMNYVAAGDVIPKTVWLTYFMTQGDGLVDIKGVSSNVTDISVFFKNMRDSLIGTKLRLQKLEMVSQSVDDAVSGTSGSNYSFEITNMTTDQLGALMGGLVPAAASNSSQPAPQNNQQTNNNSAPQSGLLSQEPIQGN